MSRKAYEYLIISVNPWALSSDGEPRATKVLNNLGREGFELVSVFDGAAYFKRETVYLRDDERIERVDN